MQQFEPLHLEWFSDPKIYLLTSECVEDEGDQAFHDGEVEHEDALHDAELLSWVVDVGARGEGGKNVTDGFLRLAVAQNVDGLDVVSK